MDGRDGARPGEAARHYARSWMRAYGILTDRPAEQLDRHPMMATLPALLERFAADPAARPPSPGGDAADLAREVERLRAHFELPAALTAADVVDWAIGGAVEDGERIGKVNRHALRMQERADAATARAVAAERERDEAIGWVRRFNEGLQGRASDNHCPACHWSGGFGHAPDCALAAALATRPSGADPGRGTGDASKGEVGHG